MGATDREVSEIYEFEDFRLDVDDGRLEREGERIRLEPKTFLVLVELVRSANRRVTTARLLASVWTESYVEENAVTRNVSLLRKALGDSALSPRFIATEPGAGYRFIAAIRKVEVTPTEAPVLGATSAWIDSGAREGEPSRAAAREGPSHAGGDADRRDRAGARRGEPSARWQQDAPHGSADVDAEAPLRLPSGSWYVGHALFACAVYPALYVVALFVEVAYRMDRFGAIAHAWALPVFAWVGLTSAVAFWTDWRLTRAGSRAGMLWSLVVFVAAGFALPVALLGVLPPERITKATFTTFTAQAAFLKTCFYFVVAAVGFMAIPFHVVVALREELRRGNGAAVRLTLSPSRAIRPPTGTIFLRAWWLGLGFVVLGGAVMYGTAHLIENLQPSPYYNAFTQLLEWRVLGYLALCLECVAWYTLSLGRLREAAAHRTPNRLGARWTVDRVTKP